MVIIAALYLKFTIKKSSFINLLYIGTYLRVKANSKFIFNYIIRKIWRLKRDPEKNCYKKS